MLTIENLQIRADPSKSDLLIDGLSFKIEQGEAVGLAGPSGCGKTTLLRSIAGLIDPAGGRVLLDDQTPEQIGWAPYRRRVGLVAQRPIVWDGTVWQNLCRPKKFNSVQGDFTRDTCDTMLEAVGLYNMLDVEANTLSEGERQRVCLVRSLMTAPRFVLLDEPTSALDHEAVKWVEAILIARMGVGSGCGVVVVSHDRAFIERFCTRVIDLADYTPAGKAVADA